MTETAPALADLDQLNEWINNPDNRHAWRAVVASRQAAQIDRKREEFEATLPSRRHLVTSEDHANALQALDDAEARTELAGLAESFAEHTRLRLAIVLVEYRTADSAEDARNREALAWAIRSAVLSIMYSLTEAQHADPGEVLRNAKALFTGLFDRRRSIAATLSTLDLDWWAAELGRANRVIDLAPAAD